MAQKVSISVGNHTDKGMVRKNNQDSFGSAKNSWGELYIVADGMGGHLGGEVASKIAVDHLCDAFKTGQGENDPIQFLDSTIQEANKAVLNEASKKPEYEGMGTTVVAVIIKNNIAYFAHVGDSRIYLYRYKKKFFVTKDHSVVQDLLDKGLINEQEAENHPQSNRILQAVGTAKISVTITTHELYKGDYLLLCSDGVTGEVTENEILSTVLKLNPMPASKALIDMANKNGGSDNSTCIVIKVENGPNAPVEQLSGKNIAHESGDNYSKYKIAGAFLLLGVFFTVVGQKVYDNYIKKPEFTVKVRKGKIGAQPDIGSIKSSPKDSVRTTSGSGIDSVKNVINKLDSLAKEDTLKVEKEKNSSGDEKVKNK